MIIDILFALPYGIRWYLYYFYHRFFFAIFIISFYSCRMKINYVIKNMDGGIMKRNQVTAVSLLLIIILGFRSILSSLLESCHSLFTYTLVILFDETIVPLLIQSFVVLLIYFVLEEFKGKLQKKDKYVIIAAIVVIMIGINLFTHFPVEKERIMASGEYPSKIEYYITLGKDIIGNETETVTLSKDEAKIETYTKKVHRKYGSMTIKIHYFHFVGSDKLSYTCTVCDDLKKEIDSIMDSINTDGLVMIEYYKNSGVVKSINGHVIN